MTGGICKAWRDSDRIRRRTPFKESDFCRFYKHGIEESRRGKLYIVFNHHTASFGSKIYEDRVLTPDGRIVGAFKIDADKLEQRIQNIIDAGGVPDESLKAREELQNYIHSLPNDDPYMAF